MQGEYRTAIQYAQMLLQHDPLHEDVYRSLMRLYALTDDRAAALRTYQTCTAILKRELDVEPSPATKQAHERLLNLQSATALPPQAPIPLVGHAREWSRLQEAWRMVARGQPHWVMLTGAAGIGKTRLAEELLRWAAKQGIPTATARCYAAESGLGYGPITTWLRARPLPALEKLWLGEIARLLPELLIQQPDLPSPGPLTESWQRLRFFEALARAVLASQPLILLIDDIQYCDRDTLEWLHYLLRFNPQASLLLVSTLCLEDLAPDHPVHPLLATFRRAGQLSEIGVQPLSSTETAELAAQVQGRSLEPALATKLFAETEGSPLFVLEMVRSGQLAQADAPLPRTIQAVIGARLGQLSPETHQLVQVAAVIGRAFTIDILGKASGAGEEALARGLAELRQRRIVRAPQGDAYDFDHSQLRAVAYANLNPAERQMLHRRVAEALVELQDPAPNGHSGEIVEH
jgi:predicted ATPase